MYFQQYMVHFGLCTSTSTGSILAHATADLADRPHQGATSGPFRQHWLGVIALVDGHARALLQPPPRVSSFGPTAGQAILLHVLELGALGALRNGR